MTMCQLRCLVAVLTTLISSCEVVFAAEDLFEHIAVYSLQSGNYTLSIAPSTSETTTSIGGGMTFEDESFAFMVLPTASADEDGLEAAEEEATEVWQAFAEGSLEPTDLVPGDEALPDESVVYRLDLVTGNLTPPVAVEIPVSESGAYAFVLQHATEEISAVVLDTSGVTVDAAVEESVEDHDNDHDDDDASEDGSSTGAQWTQALSAAVIISACSFIGILAVASRGVSRRIDLSHACLLASGALLTATLMHILPEALEGLEEEFSDIHDVGLRAGFALMVGIFFALIVHALVASGHSHDHSHPTATPGAKAGDKGKNGDSAQTFAALAGTSRTPDNPTEIHATERAPNAPENATLDSIISASKTRNIWDLKGLHPVCWNVILGDFVHNFADGVTVGAAFLNCSSTVGWTVAAATVLHEIPHELADFMALVNGGMAVAQAILYNFLSALSAVAGVVLVLALDDDLNSADVSYLLLLGGGTFFFIALSELVPGAMTASSSTRTTTTTVSNTDGSRSSSAETSMTKSGRAKKILSFTVGALLIGIPLIWHEHCESADSGHSH